MGGRGCFGPLQTDWALLRNPCEYGPFQAVSQSGTWTQRWSGAGRCGGSLASRRPPGGGFALVRESPESVRKSLRTPSRGRRHTIPTFRQLSADAARSLPLGDEAYPAPRAHRSAWPRGPPLPSPRDCFGPLRNGSGPRNDDGGFLPLVTSEGREQLAMTTVVGFSSQSRSAQPGPGPRSPCPARNDVRGYRTDSASLVAAPTEAPLFAVRFRPFPRPLRFRPRSRPPDSSPPTTPSPCADEERRR